jgi:hypothetical protein
MHVSVSNLDSIAVISFANGPVNALSVGAGLVDALAEAIAKALDDPA